MPDPPPELCAAQLPAPSEPYVRDRVALFHGDCREVLKRVPDASFDALVTDPPYGLEFMGKEWDAPWKATAGGFSKPGIGRETPWPSFKGSNRSRCSTCGLLIGQGGSRCDCAKPCPVIQDSVRMIVFQQWFEPIAVELLRVLKPGGYLLCFGGTRTYHRITCAIEDAGFEVRDCLLWLYGQGFPKSLDVSKALDKAAGATREVVAEREEHDICRPEGGGDERLMTSAGKRETRTVQTTAPATDAAKQWAGWGTALKPAYEPIIMARKPLDGTVAQNVVKHGVGALNIDASRIAVEERPLRISKGGPAKHAFSDGLSGSSAEGTTTEGRYPANLLLDEDAAAALDAQTGVLKSGDPAGVKAGGQLNCYGKFAGGVPVTGFGDQGGASRFFYCAKASRADRDYGLPEGVSSKHPTVKPLALMRYLLRLVTPPGATVLDPFFGSGSTGVAAVLEGIACVGIEADAESFHTARQRIGGAVDAAEFARAADESDPPEAVPTKPQKRTRRRKSTVDA